MNGPQTEAELEEYLSRPTGADVAHAATLRGDLLILGAGGKMGPSLARLAKRSGARVIAVARFTDRELPARLQGDGIETIACDMLEPGALAKLPDAPNVIFMAARKFGTAGAEYLTWAMNTFLPGLVAERYRDSKIVAFSTGNVYPLTPVKSGGATETAPPAPVGEYAQSALGRERMFEYGSSRWGTRAAILRLNYAVEMRYGVLADIGRAVFERRPVDVGMGFVNVIWQRDANSVALRALSECANPPLVLNLTGPETLSTCEIALGFGKRFGVEPLFRGAEGSHALLNDAAMCHGLFGYPTVTPETLMDWIAEWIARGNSQWNKPTHFEVRDGKF
ncbi:MAG TPA: NAD-dependent epimerase/dehydratase family protein [Bryobacteraceae bacterium]